MLYLRYLCFAILFLNSTCSKPNITEGTRCRVFSSRLNREVRGRCAKIQDCPYGTSYKSCSSGLVCCLMRPELPPGEGNCPPLDNPRTPPNLNTAQLIAWNKCLEYQRFVKKCEPQEDGGLTRVDKCKIPTEGYNISGVTPANTTQFPHMVELGVHKDYGQFSASDDVEWVGGGALISDRFILTAAHALIDRWRRPLRFARLGVGSRLHIGLHNPNGYLYTIVREMVHPLHNYRNRVHDIALLELDSGVVRDEFIRPICLPVPGQRGHPSSRIIADWGQNFESVTDSPSPILYTAQVSVQMDHTECESKFETPKFHYNSSTMLCAKGTIDNEAKVLFHDDSGGPLMMLLDNVHCSFSIEGVVSFGPRCGQGSAGVYTKVDAYLHWIVRNVWPEDWARATMANDDLF